MTQMGCALLGLSAAGSGFLGAHMTASIGGADMPVVRLARDKSNVRIEMMPGVAGGVGVRYNRAIALLGQKARIEGGRLFAQ